MLRDQLLPSILQYIVDEELAGEGEGGLSRLPSMDELCRQLGISRGKLREQLIAAQAWGVVEMRPGDGTYVQPLDFYTPTRTLVMYSITRDRSNFNRFYALRTHLEIAFWVEATRKLTPEDRRALQEIIKRADERLGGYPVEIPHREHRNLHMLTFARLDNGFVQGLLNAYWDAYEAVGLHLYFDYSYYEEMWSSHRAIVDAILADQYEEGRDMLAQHFTLLGDRLGGRAG